MKILKSNFILMMGLLSCLTVSHLPLHAGFYDNVMSTIDDEFERAENKLSVVSKSMDYEYVAGFSERYNGMDSRHLGYRKEDTPIDNMQLYPLPSKELDVMQRTNPLALAICKADVKRVEKFLKIIENPNDPALLIRGYRQVYNLVSLAADPVWPLHEPHKLQDRLKIIDLLGAAHFDFNFTPPNIFSASPEDKNFVGRTTYSNPPLIAVTALHGAYGGIYDKDEEEGQKIWDYRNAVRARLMLYGADPTLNGSSSFELARSERDLRLCLKLALNQIIDEKLTNIRPTEYVKGLLEEVKKERIEEEERKFEEFKALMANLKF